MRSRWRIVIREWVLKPFATVHLALMDQLAMNRTVKFTRLRLGTSILLLASCLLLAVLWVHSYWWRDSLVASLPGVHSAFIESDAGEMAHCNRSSGAGMESDVQGAAFTLRSEYTFLSVGVGC